MSGLDPVPERDARFWKLYREERLKIVKQDDPTCKRPFQVALTAPQITHAARQAQKRYAAGST